MERNSSIDYIKGSLIFTVIIGHILLGSLDANLIRYVIYSFHMPAFFFISGYLLNIEKIRLLCFCQLIGKYWKRVLLPWSIAWVVYTAYVVYDNLSFGAVANNILNPYYHLWYVPSLFMMIVIVWTASRYFDNVKNILFFLFVTGILLFNFSNTPYSIGSAWNCRMLPFFALGIVGRRLLIDIKWGGNSYTYILGYRYMYQVGDGRKCTILSYLLNVTAGGIIMHIRHITIDAQKVVTKQGNRILG